MAQVRRQNVKTSVRLAKKGEERSSLCSNACRVEEVDHNLAKGHILVVTRAISARVNQNFDGWPSKELKKAYRTFIGKPIYVNHENYDPTRTRGVLVGSNYHEHGDDKFIECFMDVDGNAFPKLAKEIIDGNIDSVSMGANISSSTCSVCGNRAVDSSDFCTHIANQKGEMVWSEKEGREVPVFENCEGVSFFELSFVFDPADETALTHTVKSANTKGVSEMDMKKLALEPRSIQRFSVYADDVVAPPKIDTMEAYDVCPDCGTEDWDGEICEICEYVSPPAGFDEPDLEKNKEVERRDEVENDSTEGKDAKMRKRTRSLPATRQTPTRPKSARRRVASSIYYDQAKAWMEYEPNGWVLSDEFGRWFEAAVGALGRDALRLFEEEALGMPVQEWIEGYLETVDDYGNWDTSRFPRPKISKARALRTSMNKRAASLVTIIEDNAGQFTLSDGSVGWQANRYAGDPEQALAAARDWQSGEWEPNESDGWHLVDLADLDPHAAHDAVKVWTLAEFSKGAALRKRASVVDWGAEVSKAKKLIDGPEAIMSPLSERAEGLYDQMATYEDFVRKFSPAELIALWYRDCLISLDEDRWGASYDDEVYDALNLLGYWDQPNKIARRTASMDRTARRRIASKKRTSMNKRSNKKHSTQASNLTIRQGKIYDFDAKARGVIRNPKIKTCKNNFEAKRWIAANKSKLNDEGYRRQARRKRVR